MLIIDGHNLLHAICKIEESPRGLGELALCRILGTYLKLTGKKAEIIFDGTGPPDKSGFDAIGNLEAVKAGSAYAKSNGGQVGCLLDPAPKTAQSQKKAPGAGGKTSGAQPE
ncbi:MAG: hypothetical protein ACYTAO_03435 [Planctomycetota bacterium]|jgi:hypothetical protein